MRILFVTNNYTPYSGGVVSSIQSTVQELQRRGYSVELVTLNFLGSEHNDPSFVHRVPSVMRFKRKQNHIAVPWRMRSFIKQQIATFKPDIIHVHHPFLLATCSLKLARLSNIPVVFTYHTVYEAYAHYLPVPTALTRTIIKKKAIQFCNKVDAVIAPSKAIADDIASAGVYKPIVVIASAIKSQFLKTPFIPKQHKKEFSLLSVGRFTPEKNIEMVIDLFARLPQDGSFTLTLVGYGVLEQQLKDRAFKKYQLSTDLVRFIIKPSRLQLLALYKTANLFIFTSTTDTQGLVLAESMSQGTPVVALDGPGQRSIVKNGENGFIVKVHELVDIIKEIAHNVGLAQQLQQGAWQTAREYSPYMCGDKLVALYKECVGYKK